MSGTSWAQQAVDNFFKTRKYPTQTQCNDIARSTSAASNIYNVNTPGSMSYTVVCTHRQAALPALVVSFREPEAYLDQTMGKLAQEIHGSLVPEVSQHGVVDGADPPLAIYTMPYLAGISCLDALACQVEMDQATEARHACFVSHLARYFARSRSAPQNVTPEARADNLEGIQRRLDVLLGSPSVLGPAALSELQDGVAVLFASDYPQVLTHGDFSRTNILVDERTYGITGIVDWALAAVLPFGLELDCLFLMTGFMDRGGWHDYACRSRLQEVFWDEFWSASGVVDDGERVEIRGLAERAARIGAVLRYAFRRNADGSPSETLASDGSLAWRYLKAWITA